MENDNAIKSFLKAGFQGNTGTGKTMTAGLLLLALSVERHSKAPVLVFDTEPGWQFVKPMFKAEGVDLIIRNGRHFKGLISALAEAKKSGCCGFDVDSLTHPWTELLQQFADRSGRVPMHKFNQIKPMWNEYVVNFMDAPMHCIACGRLQWEMVTMEHEDGGYDVVRGDSKMKAGGGESFGYEPHLLVEMTHEQIRGNDGKLKGIEYVGIAVKDRSRALNGQEVRFQDFRQYKKGSYRQVYEAFLPHLKAIDEISGAKIGTENSSSLVPGGDAQFHRDKKQKEQVLEEIENTLTLAYPKTDQVSKRAKLLLIEAVFGLRSWTGVQEKPLRDLTVGRDWLMAFEKSTRGQVPTDDRDVLKAIADCRQGKRDGVIDGSQLKTLWKRSNDLGWNDDSVHKMLIERFGLESTKQIPVTLYDDVMRVIESGT